MYTLARGTISVVEVCHYMRYKQRTVLKVSLINPLTMEITDDSHDG